MQKKFSFPVTLILILVLALVLSTSATLAQGDGVTWSSAYQVQNLESSDATVTISYYDQSASGTDYNGSATIPANGSVTVFPFVAGDNVSGGPTTFAGSVVLSSDKAIAAILNTQSSSSPFYGASTNGFSQGATSISLPLIACENSGFDTWFNVQNTGTTNANITVNYIKGSAGADSTETATIEPNRAKTYDQRTGTTTGTLGCDTLGGTDGKFVGGATITSDQPIVASVMFLGTGSFQTVQGYNGFTSGGTTLNMPLIMANNSSFYTAMQIQNAGSAETTITVTYGANTGTGSQPIDEQWTIPAGGSQTVQQIGAVSVVSKNNWNNIGQYIGSATITQSGSEPLVAIVNQNATAFTSLGSTYEAFDPSAATTTINMPLIVANNSGFATAFQVQAIEAATNVTVTYSENTVEAGEIPAVDTFTLTNAGDSYTMFQTGDNTVGGAGNNNWDVIDKYIGSAQVTADKPIVAIVNFNGPTSGSGDTFFTYDGFNQ